MFSVFNTANDIPQNYFKERKVIKAVVVDIIDGDTYRVRHITRWRYWHTYKGSLKDNTIVVRIAAVDCPETAKFGKPGQKFGEESKIFATQKLLGKPVLVKLISKDQYGRVIGLVNYKDSRLHIFTSSRRDISEELLRSGLATVYRQGGAQYDGGVERWNKLEATATQKRKGMWVNGADGVQLPSDYKKQQRKSKPPAADQI